MSFLRTTCASALLAATFTAAPGCANLVVGRPIPVEKVQEVREGYTGRDRVLTLFGQPLRRVPNEDGEIWVYRYLNGRGTSQELVVTFSGDAVSTIVYQ